MKTLVLKASSSLSAPLAGTPVVPPFDPSLLFSYTKASITASAGKVTKWANAQGVLGTSADLTLPSSNAPSVGVDGVVFAESGSNSIATAVFPSSVSVPALTVICRLKFSSAANVNPGTIFSSADAANYAYLRRLANGTLTSGVNAADAMVTGATAAIGSFVDLAIVFNGASSRIYINDTLAVSGTTGSAALSSFRIGANAGGAIFLNAEVKQLNAYSRALSAAEIAEIRATFA